MSLVFIACIIIACIVIMSVSVILIAGVLHLLSVAKDKHTERNTEQEIGNEQGLDSASTSANNESIDVDNVSSENNASKDSGVSFVENNENFTIITSHGEVVKCTAKNLHQKGVK